LGTGNSGKTVINRAGPTYRVANWRRWEDANLAAAPYSSGRCPRRALEEGRRPIKIPDLDSASTVRSWRASVTKTGRHSPEGILI